MTKKSKGKYNSNSFYAEGAKRSAKVATGALPMLF
jgi:hypothetical protein